MTKNNGVEIHGIDEILENIAKLGGNFEKAGQEAIKEGAAVLRDELEKNTPKNVFRSKAHAKDNVVVSNMKTNRELGTKYVSVGFPKGIKHRIHFIEFGTIRQKPQLFMTRTVNSIKDEVKSAMIESLKGAMKL